MRLQTNPAQGSAEPFGKATSRLRTAVQLATVCSAWREASAHACQAWAQSSLSLSPRDEHLPQCLSPLLGRLVSGCRSMWLDAGLLTAPNVAPFLELAKPQHLAASSWIKENDAAVGAVLATCPYLLDLSCHNGLVPTAFPPRLRSLMVDLNNTDAPTVETLLQRVAALGSLSELRLLFTQSDSCVPEHLPAMPFLRELTLSISHGPDETPCLLGLQDAAAQGITIGLDVHLFDCEEEDGEMPAEARERLWAALAKLPTLSSLCLLDELENVVEVPASAREQGLLTFVHCRELVLHCGLWPPCTSLLLHTLRCDIVFVPPLLWQQLCQTRAMVLAVCQSWRVCA